jgi:hypothetical protein
MKVADMKLGDEVDGGRRRRAGMMAGTARLAAALSAALTLAGCASTGPLSAKPDFGEPRVSASACCAIRR